MKNVKMIITDLDETLLNSDKCISEHTISVLEKCKLKGIKIVFATARSMQSASKILEQFMPDIFIGYGGALVLAIKAVSDFYNINTNMFVAFGNDKNDLEMIKNCGIGIAVENAINEVKNVAKYICETNNNDGVARWLEKYIL